MRQVKMTWSGMMRNIAEIEVEAYSIFRSSPSDGKRKVPPGRETHIRLEVRPWQAMIPLRPVSSLLSLPPTMIRPRRPRHSSWLGSLVSPRAPPVLRGLRL